MTGSCNAVVSLPVYATLLKLRSLIYISLQFWVKGAPLHFNLSQTTAGWAVLEHPVLGPPVLSSSLKALTGLNAGERFSNSTGLLDLATFVWEISWGCIIHESDYGSPCFKTTAANYHVQVPRPSSLASIVKTPGGIAGPKYSRSMLKERELEQSLPIKTHSTSTFLLPTHMCNSVMIKFKHLNAC